jgi:alkylhydroperoxidase family enzyme
MTTSTPRIPPLEADQWDATAQELMARLPPFNVFKTFANHSALMQRWGVFARHVLRQSTLTARDRELLILRIGWLCRCAYEWGQHVLEARRANLSDEEIRRVQAGPDAPGWSDAERLLLAATDELHANSRIGDATWQGLAAHFNTQQLMDIVFTVGQYNMVSMALNSFGVQPDVGLPGFDA